MDKATTRVGKEQPLRFADAGLTGNQKEAAAASYRIVKTYAQFHKLAFAADEHADCTLGWRLGVAHRATSSARGSRWIGNS